MYGEFAKIYDSFMDNIPYEMWADQIRTILHTYGIRSGIVADLGCGTGTLTELLAGEGYDMIGIDLSEEMLQEAVEKRDKSGQSILYLHQDMREFELYGTCAAIVSRCDSINYLTDYADLVQCFRLVNNYLDPDGIFIFDVKSEYMYRELLGCNTFARSNENGSYIWENYYDEARRINQYYLTLYCREQVSGAAPGQEDDFRAQTSGAAEQSSCTAEPSSGAADRKLQMQDSGPDALQRYAKRELYTRAGELHEQRAYRLEELKTAAGEAGLLWISAVDSDTEGPIDEETTRYLITLKECGKK